MIENYYNFEDFSLKIKPVKYSTKKLTDKIFEYENCSNNNLISKSSFTRLFSIIKNKDFAIISAYRRKFNKYENILRNRKLRSIFNKKKMGVYQLVGHWLEAPDNKDWNTTDKSDLVDTVERSYLVAKPDNMNLKDFISLIYECMTIDNETQDSVLIHKKIDDGYYLMFKGNPDDFMYIGNKFTLNKISQAYSQYVKNIDLPFVFEGLEIPGSNSGSLMFKKFQLLTI